MKNYILIIKDFNYIITGELNENISYSLLVILPYPLHLLVI